MQKEFAKTEIRTNNVLESVITQVNTKTGLHVYWLTVIYMGFDQEVENKKIHECSRRKKHEI